MSETEYREMPVSYSFFETPFGRILIAATERGICFLEPVKDDAEALQNLPFPHITQQETPQMQDAVNHILHPETPNNTPVNLHLYGTDFQQRVWHALTTIPFGTTATYAQISTMSSHSKAHRAVGTAVGRNPISILIPCHRIVRSDGSIGNYHWGQEMKRALIDWERGYTEKL